MKVVRHIHQALRNISYEIRARLATIRTEVAYDVPYVCQFAIPAHAERSLRKELETRDDPHWAETGASSPERYAEWAFTMCGMASAAMALGYFKGTSHNPAELAEDALAHQVYIEEPTMLSAMRYAEFARWIQKYGLHAAIYTKLSIKGIQYALSQNKLVIVSVNPNIRGYDTADTNQKGGHLVLVVGYDLKEGTMAINNPSGFLSTDTQVNHRLSVQEFGQYYAGRGIILSER